MTFARHITRSLGVSLAVLIVAYGLYLLLVGQQITFQEEVPIGAAPAEQVTRHLPAVQGVIPLAAGVVILVGLVTQRLLVAWVGALAASAFAGLFVFGVGGILIPVAVMLLVALGGLTWSIRSVDRNSAA